MLTLLLALVLPGGAEVLPTRIPGVDARDSVRDYDDARVQTRRVALANPSGEPLRIPSAPSLALKLPPGEYTLYTLYGGWGQERQLAAETLGAGARVLTSRRGRSSSIYSPWFALRNQTTGITYAGQLEWSGNWTLSVERVPARAALRLSAVPVEVRLGMEFDSPGYRLDPGETLDLAPAVFTAVEGDLDDAVNQLHRYQRLHVFPRRPGGGLPWVQFNSWYPFPGKMTAAEMMRAADVAAELGAEVFVLDAGWYNRKNWSRELGDYQADRAAFPNGIEELSAHVRKLGLKFGMWVEIENGGSESRLFAGHPDWFFQLGGKPLKSGERYHLDFAKPEVRAWARGVVDRLVRDYRLEWIKIDYNIDIGWEFDDPSAKGGVLMRHLAAYYRWLDEVRAAHPQLFIENCSSGGLRFDLGILRHTHSTWLSDEVKPRESVQLGYGCTVEFAPEVCNHWMVGDTNRGDIQPGAESGWWDFMLRVPMNGQYGISSKVFEWSPELRERARANVALYKRIRPAIVGADVYHLTPPPDHNAPEGWTGVQYVTAGGGRSVLMAYRCQGGEAARSFKLRGLDPSKTYRVRIDEKDRGVMTGAQLGKEGLKLELAEWRAAVVELE